MPVRAIRSLAFEDLKVGLSELVLKTVTDQDIVGFADISGDQNPIHLSDLYASKTRFGQRIAHGLYTASLISAVIGTRLPGPGAVYMSQTLNFKAPVKIGDVVRVHVEVAELIENRQRARLACECAVDATVVLDGEAWVRVPSRLELTAAA
ncbi:MaoC family dehydratase [Phreatobacter sp. AB_2022a]|uniref:MaoC family dehydratase n=1 Tax=Phreatobacter sp. AB_2022a TaxID=3003134 RepID=UPI002286D34C|nr:MaoC family dehydratase [Phreatobacter sp. AB_2022a]MCZ0738756.1 MaoC family dehydratase [Phreatobacter sp. AB_2022a]